MNVGYDNWPLPIPLVRQLQTIGTLKGVVAAQGRYHAEDLDGNGVKDHASSFWSKPGTRSGLYWPSKAGWPESPAGPLVAAVAGEGYIEGRMQGPARASFHGYDFRVLKKQGPHARGGAYDYAANGNLVGGFAIVAWPSEHRQRRAERGRRPRGRSEDPPGGQAVARR